MKCYYCQVELGDTNKTKEHIILDSLGGNLTSTNILCRTCNNFLGSNNDLNLFNQLKAISSLLGINNHPVEMQTIDGEKIVVGKKLSPYYRATTYVPNKEEGYTFWKKNRTEALELVEKKNQEIKAKFSDISLRLEEYENDNRGKVFYIVYSKSGKPGETTMGGRGYFKAILKMSISFAYDSGIDLKYLNNGILSLKGANIVPINFYYPTNYIIRIIAPKEVSHLLYIKGDPITKILLVYSELFSTNNHIVILSNDYEGEPISKIYHQDLLNNQIIENTSINIIINKGQILDFQSVLNSMKDNNTKEHLLRYNLLLQLIEKIQLQ